MSTSNKAASRSRGAAARAEGPKTRTITVAATKFKVPAKAPFEMVRYMRGDNIDVVGVLEVVLGEEQLQKVWDLGLDLEQGRDLCSEILKNYGVTTGE